ncbi:MAG: lipopolysaccharide biosynthesis protein RfbH, partial [Desulfocucumaceae bacterium]
MSFKEGDILKIEGGFVLAAASGAEEYYVWPMVEPALEGNPYILEAGDLVLKKDGEIPLGIDLTCRLKIKEEDIRGMAGAVNRRCLEKLWRG